MLEDRETGLKTSTKYVETHRTVRGPEGSREFHKVSSYSSGGGDPGDFNLERQVHHIIPPPSPSLDRHFSALQSANMVSSVQQQKLTTFTTYKVQSNQYSSSGARVVPLDYGDGERPGSRLKQNIDELDTLLSDLNNARGTTNGDSQHQHQPQSQGSKFYPHVASSDDYSLSDNGQVKRTFATSSNEYNYQSSSNNNNQQLQQGGDYYSRKPPSPSLARKRAPGSPGPGVQPSPVPVRKSSPGPSSSIALTSSSSYSYNLHQASSNTNGNGPDYNRPDLGPGGSSYRSPSPYGGPPSDKLRGPSPSPSGPRAPRDGTPTGVSYYSKYHSTHSHQSQKTGGGPMAFPTGTPPHHGSQTIQSPPKRVDELMSELADFDPSIQPGDISEPVPSSRSRSHHIESSTVISDSRRDDRDYHQRPMHQSQSPNRPAKQPSTPGPPVYYPPGEVFGSTKRHTGSAAAAQPAPAALAVEQSAADGGRGRAEWKREYGYKEKGRGAESDSKGGAAVVPICLPLCCAAPCVIL